MQLLVVVRGSATDDIMFWILVGGIIPSVVVGVFMQHRHEMKFKYEKWIEESPDDEKGFFVVSKGWLLKTHFLELLLCF